VKYLLDTSVCVELIRGRGSRVLKRMAQRPTGDFALSSITVAELQYGVWKSPQMPQEREALDEFLQPLMTLEFDFAATEVYGRIRAQLEAAGTPVGALDTLIAAHAISRDLTLLTRNLKEFKRVPGLKGEDWTKG
jgi:tRNA(fMet)-specific endonuclease VapC